MIRSIQAIAAQARRENDINGLPCGDYVYTDICQDQQDYRTIEAILSPQEYEAKRAKKEAERLARIEAAKKLLPKEIDLAIKVLEAARQNSLWNTHDDLCWDLIPVISKLRRMQDDNS
jgi:hypothetical protein